jgi:hypothetical protein
MKNFIKLQNYHRIMLIPECGSDGWLDVILLVLEQSTVQHYEIAFNSI